MTPADPVLFVPSQPGGPELLLPFLLFALGLVIGYLFGRTDWPRWGEWVPVTEP